VTPRTVADYIQARAGLSLWCPHCQKGRLVDLTTLPPDLDLTLRPLPIACEHCFRDGEQVRFSYHGPGTQNVSGRYWQK
jgi:hypothetical protein